MKVFEITDYLEKIAPIHLQEGYDKAGLIVGDPKMEGKGAILCLDSIEEIIEEAIARDCNLIIAHHPIIFGGLKKLNGKNYVERTVQKAIKNDIAIYAIHTNLDNVYLNGVNGKFAEKLQLKKTRILAPKDINTPEIGAGMIGELAEPMEALEFLEYLKLSMGVSCVRHTSILDRPVKKVALCGGSGSFLLNQALQQEADVFITGDFKYHEFFDADGKIIIADIGHYESEQYTIELLFEIISQKFSNFALHLTTVNTNPINYL